MVTQFGMSDKLGNVDLRSNYNRLSSETKQVIESEVRRTIEEGRQRAMNLLTQRRSELELLARALIAYETLDKAEAFKVIKGEKLEGKAIMPSGNIKRPEGTNGAPGTPIPLPAIPGSAAAGAEEGNQGGPPKGGVMA
jgi:ATP-dependent metalloprotease